MTHNTLSSLIGALALLLLPAPLVLAAPGLPKTPPGASNKPQGPPANANNGNGNGNSGNSGNSSDSGHGTPDGLTPAAEQDCDGLFAPLYGICVAYCEAQDCHLDSVPSSACDTILIVYRALSGGMDPPCPGDGAADDGGAEAAVAALAADDDDDADGDDADDDDAVGDDADDDDAVGDDDTGDDTGADDGGGKSSDGKGGDGWNDADEPDPPADEEELPPPPSKTVLSMPRGG